mgnify:FL=1
MGTVLTVKNATKKRDITLADSIFAVDYREALVHQVVTAYQSAGRSGSKAQKNRSQVSGGGAKPWRQKGTGRARAGTSRSPIWRGGGRTFAATPRNFGQKINRKMYKAAVKSMLSELLRQKRISVIENLIFEAPKTKKAKELLIQLAIDSALFVTTEVDKNFALSLRNIPSTNVIEVSELNPLSIMQYENLIFTCEAVKKIEDLLI